jgi:hypothetical protein
MFIDDVDLGYRLTPTSTVSRRPEVQDIDRDERIGLRESVSTNQD